MAELVQGKIETEVAGFEKIPLPGAGEGETAYFHPESKTLGIDQKHIITMGDSENDKGLLCFPYQTNQSISRIFVGNKDSLFQSFQKNSIEKEFLYLKNMLTKGSELIFRSLKSAAVPST